MGITNKHLAELLAVVCKDIPRLPIQDVLSITCKTEAEVELITRFIKKHYTNDEVLKASNDHLKMVKRVLGE